MTAHWPPHSLIASLSPDDLAAPSLATLCFAYYDMHPLHGLMPWAPCVFG